MYRDGGPGVGKLVSVHRDQSGGCLLVALAAFIVMLGAWTAAMGPVWQGAAYVVLAIVLFVVGRRWLAPRAHTIELCEHGLIERRSGTVTTIRFEEVTAVTKDRRVRYRYGVVPVLHVERHTIEARDGRRIAFGMIRQRAEDLVAAIGEHVTSRLRLEALRAFDAGETVRFGRFALSESGLQVDDARPIPWSDVARVAVTPKRTDAREGTDFIQVWKAGEEKPSVECEVSLLPNVAILVEMAELAAEQAREA